MSDMVQTTFLGASVVNFTSSIGWNGDSTSVAVRVVEDLSNGDDFDPPNVGTPVSFRFGDFYYRGLLQHWEKRNDIGGEVYDIAITDAREVLDGSKIVINSYSGATNSVDNLINVYGYYESGGFGLSAANDGGMYYSYVKAGIEALVSARAAPAYGNALKLRNVEYTVNLNNLPVPPSYYRVQGDTHISFLDLISQLCFDGGFDFFLTLDENNTIIVKTVSRNYTPSLTKINAFIASKSDRVVNKSVGREFRNEVTSAFLVGADQELLHQTNNIVGSDTIWPYWGTDDNNIIVVGTGYGDEHTVDLNATAIANIIGSNKYTASVLEMRFALINETSWLTYLVVNKPSLANYIGATAKYDPRTVPDSLRPLFETDLFNKSALRAAIMAQRNDSDHQNKIYQVYQFVRGFAENFYGKKWLIRLPFISRKIESDTFKIIYSQEPASAGYISETASPLGLTGELSELFKDSKNRFFPFMRYNNITNADLSDLRLGSDAVILDNVLYVRAELQPKIVYAGGIPCAVCELPRTIFQRGTTPQGDQSAVASLFAKSLPDMQKVWKNSSGGFLEVAIHPQAIGPDGAAVPLKSNQSVYGPWIKTGPAGKIDYRRDTGLAPWEFGGYYVLNLVAQATIENIVTRMQEGETGFVEVVGFPELSIGDELIGGGPNVTGISISIGPDGVKTTYQMRTFTPRYGGYNKQAIETIRRLILGQQERNVEKRRLLAEALAKLTPPPKSSGVDYYKFQQKEVRPHSPHPILAATIEQDSDNVRVKVSTLTNGEAWANNNSDDTTRYVEQTAYMGLEGLVRPFSTDISYEGLMPSFENPSGIATGTDVVDFNPFVDGNDIDVYSYGDSYSFANYNDGSPADGRMFALRGPLVVAGWGYGIDGTSPTGLMSTNYLRDFSSWKVGPVDLLWDNRRKMWTTNTLLPAKTASSFTSGQTNKIKLYNDDSNLDTTLYNAKHFHNGTIASGTNILVQYSSFYNGFVIISADC